MAKTKKKTANKKPGTKKLAKKQATPVVIGSKHFVARRLKLVEHAHTGKFIHFRHTSHFSLMAILLLIGFFLFFSGSYVGAGLASNAETVNVSAVVLGEPPSEGAIITTPKDGEIFEDKVVEISGTCFEKSFVVIRDNGLTVGSTNCTAAGIFLLKIQLFEGDNILSALNYDNANQVGPMTGSITVRLGISAIITSSEDALPTQLPINPSVIEGIQSEITGCNNLNVGDLPDSPTPHVSVACVPRLILPKIEQVMGIVVWGGTPPYAVSIDHLGGDDVKLLSVSSPGYKTVSLSYGYPDVYRVALNLTDQKGDSAYAETSVQVSGTVISNSSTRSDERKSDSLGVSTNLSALVDIDWYKSPVPLYAVAVAITVGFWVGDHFSRKTYLKSGVNSGNKKVRRA